MNILQPELIKIGKRNYRRNDFKLASFNQDVFEDRPYEEETVEMFTDDRIVKHIDCEKLYNDDGPCVIEPKRQLIEDDDDLNDIDLVNNEYYQCKLKVDPSYYGFIIGRNGEKKSNLERETNTRIKIPPRNQDDTIKIEGDLMKSVASCRNRLLILISSARLQKPFNYLITFPLNFDQLKLKFLEFKETVLNDKNCSKDRGVSSTIFINPNKLHLTVCVLTLIGDSEIDQAVELLENSRNEFIKEILNSDPLNVHIKGLEYMNDDPGQVDVLYAKVEDKTNKIQQIADKLMFKFVEHGLSKKQFDRVKLHATIMNSLLTTQNDDQAIAQHHQSKNIKERESFDARNILNIYGKFDFGYYKLDEIHLSIRYSSGIDSYYDYVTKITL